MRKAVCAEKCPPRRYLVTFVGAGWFTEDVIRGKTGFATLSPVSCYTKVPGTRLRQAAPDLPTA